MDPTDHTSLLIPVAANEIIQLQNKLSPSFSLSLYLYKILMFICEMWSQQNFLKDVTKSKKKIV